MEFLNCPAYQDQASGVRCGLPAEVRCRFTMCSTDGPVDSVMIRCPAGHSFAGSAPRAFRARPDRKARRPNTSPAYYLGHPADVWLTAMRPRPRPAASRYPVIPGTARTPLPAGR
jgi:hypothetical protein